MLCKHHVTASDRCAGGADRREPVRRSSIPRFSRQRRRSAGRFRARSPTSGMIVCGRAENGQRARRKQTEFTTAGNEAITWRFGGLKMGNAMKLYNHALAPNPRRVRIFAAEKGIELTLQDVDILAGQSRTPEFLAKNPSGGVPVLELDDGSCVAESVAICRYLEGLHPEPNLFGRDLREQAQIEMWNRRMELELFAAIGRTVQNTSSIFQGRYKQFPDYGE